LPTNASVDFFEVASHGSPKTMGVWLLETDVLLPDGSRPFLMDTEQVKAERSSVAASVRK
jgi:hypothetical protein